MNHDLAVTTAFWAIVIGTSAVVLSLVAAAIIIFHRHKQTTRDNKT